MPSDNTKLKSTFLSWLFHSGKEESKESTKTEIQCTAEPSVTSIQVEIPNRRQSHLYTPFHDSDEAYVNKRRSFYSTQLSTIPDNATLSTSSLTRSATWQPSSHQTQEQVDKIPARRTSKNYSEDPEVQAKLNAVLNSEKTYYLSYMIHQQDKKALYRRSTPQNL
ncbi:uncharacterized protein B0P05DRAFT_332732 [Gilbertella persicaria]|uniref:uncharacterized protein n=1 Tax=Gilbertella persicaria TaxID=101096 RepID=UPI00221F6C33|nr:uncharacterized protein B0P05DRAFT_332732 [Gilbertella persicaria]KAI8049427.1 hypothetical protein B0P05DRAFT_332732 [Gilbertella persicaria]